MKACFDLRRRNRRGLLVCVSLLLGGCTGSGVGENANPAQQSATQDAPITGTGTLDLKVVDPEGRPLAGASVGLTNLVHQHIGSQTTNTSGMTTFVSLPPVVHIRVTHAFGIPSDTYRAAVAPEGRTSLTFGLEPRRPQPTVAVLPVSISPDSLSEDRRALTLEVTMVSSSLARFVRGSQSTAADVVLLSSQWIPSPSGQDCRAFWSNGEFICRPVSDSPYTTSSLQTNYDPFGVAPVLSIAGPIGSAMLVLDRGERVSALDPTARHSFAARQFIGRLVARADPKDLAISGLSGHAGEPGVVSLLPEQPLWALRGAGTVFTRDRLILDSAVDVLEPLVGGSSPVFDGLEEAIELTAAHAAPGTGAVVALLGGGDTLGRSPSERRAALASLRQQRDSANTQVIIIAGARSTYPESALRTVEDLSEHVALAELSSALRAPVIFLGWQSWVGGSFGALDLAADLLEGRPLPTISASFRVTTNQEAFVSGTTLHGWISIPAADGCGPFGCIRYELAFAAQIP